MVDENKVEVTDAYKFTDDEPATMQIQINPSRYATVNGESLYVTHHMEKKADGKNYVVYDYNEAQMWVPPRVGDMLIFHPDGSPDKAAGLIPMAKLLQTRTDEEAKAGIDPGEEKKQKRTRRKAEDLEVED